jgi:DNA-binding GntR family transcriptional regulator
MRSPGCAPTSSPPGWPRVPACPLKVLQHRYAVGLTPLREALTLLSGAGLVIAEQNGRGFRVAPASRADFEDVARCRRRIEAMAMRLSITEGSPDWRRRVETTRGDFAAVRALVGENRPIDEVWEARHRRFHFALISACGSPALLDFCRQLFDRFDRYRRIAIPTKSLMAEVGTDHDAIMAAALRGDEEDAVARLDRHIAATASLVRSYYDENEPYC